MSKTTTTPFLGETTKQNEAFHDIDEIDITITQDPYGDYLKHDWQRTNHYTKSNIPRYAKCANSRCQQGGLDLQSIVNLFQNGNYTFSCNGHEGTPAGRRKGNPCDNSFDIKLSVTRKND